VEGSDDNPIKVPETPNVEIENLLRFFYYGYETERFIGGGPLTDRRSSQYLVCMTITLHRRPNG
jgi:hypothetical protein